MVKLHGSMASATFISLIVENNAIQIFLEISYFKELYRIGQIYGIH